MSNLRYPLVMLIDDNELDNFINKKLVESDSFAGKAIVFQSATGALEYLRSKAGKDDEIPNVIFLDIMMPGMDGFGFLDEFDRLDDSVKKKSRIVMLSTSESFKDLNRANQNRYIYKFLNKPLSPQVLQAVNV